MEDKLQALTKRIYEEGVEKARQKAEAILAEAQEKADTILSEAKRQAKNDREQAQREADELRENVAAEIRLSARQAISALKQEMADLITFQAYEAPLKDAIGDKNFLKGIIETIVKNWSKTGRPDSGLSLILPESERELVDQYLHAAIKEQLDKTLEVRFSQKIDSGFRIGPADGSYVVSFSEKDFDNLFRDYLRPKTVQLLFGNE